MKLGAQILEDGRFVDIDNVLKNKLRYILWPRRDSNHSPGISLYNGDVTIKVDKDFTKMNCAVFPNSFQQNNFISTKLVYIKIDKDSITFSKNKISNIVGSYSYNFFGGFLVFYE